MQRNGPSLRSLQPAGGRGEKEDSQSSSLGLLAAARHGDEHRFLLNEVSEPTLPLPC